MKRFVVYARYSTDLQSEASTADQIRICQAHIDREDGLLVASYQDQAISGASRFRSDYQRMLEDCAAGRFDAVIAEALDRLSRDQEDLAALYKHLRFHDVELVTLSEGVINELHVGLKGTMNALFLKDLADKTRRGLEGRVRAGLSAGGGAFGYDTVRDLDANGGQITGLLRIKENEAEIVQRIFIAFADGESPRQIAKALNSEDIKGPRGKGWTDSTIRGHAKRGTGIINNKLYIGRFVWNRQRFIKNPKTGKRVSRLNPESEWIVHEVPDLRIISDNLWHSVKARQQLIAETSPQACPKNTTTGARRPKYLLSGLLKCGACGGGFTLISKDRYGCANRKNRGTCTNATTIRRDEIEDRVLAGLTDKLLSPDALNAFLEAYLTEAREIEQSANEDRKSSERQLRQIGKKIDNILNAIEQGVVTESTTARLKQLEAERAEINAQSPEPLALPSPNRSLIADYAEHARTLASAIYDDAIRAPAIDALQTLIDHVVVHPAAPQARVKAELYGDIAGLVQLDSQDRTDAVRLSGLESQISVVAGARTQLILRRP